MRYIVLRPGVLKMEGSPGEFFILMRLWIGTVLLSEAKHFSYSQSRCLASRRVLQMTWG